MKQRPLPAVRAGLAERRAAETGRRYYWMLIDEAEALALTDGRVPALVQSMARQLTEPLEAMLARAAAKREARR